MLRGRAIFEGEAEGTALVSTSQMSFYGGIDPRTGTVVERGSGLFGEAVRGKVLVFPSGKGSTVGSYVLYRLKKSGLAPCAMVNSRCETIVAVGAIISEIPCVDMVDIGKIGNGEHVRIKGDTVEVLDRRPSV
jgi:hypothetical protein